MQVGFRSSVVLVLLAAASLAIHADGAPPSQAADVQFQLGTLLFSGSLVAGALWQLRTGLAPVGGTALMIGWVVYALNALRR